MFDIGFWELVLVGIIALIVLGPERLPGAARTLGQWAGRARSYVRHFTSELEREVDAQDLARKARSQVAEVQRLADPMTPPATDDKASHEH